MTAHRDPDRLIHDFLMDGQTQLADPVFDAVRATIQHKRQRAVIGPWRFPDMNKLVPIGLAVAAVAVAVVAGTRLLGAPVPGGVGAAPSATAVPTPTQEPSMQAPSPSSGSIAERRFALSTTTSPVADGLAATVTLPAPGWEGSPGNGVLWKGDERDGAGLIGPWHEPLYIYGDPCHWSTTTPETPATTVDEVVAALAAQASRDASAPVDITLDGYPGKRITLRVPEDLEVPQEASFVGCDQGNFGSWGTTEEPGPARYQQFPGQIDEVWIVDIDGQAAVIDGTYYAATPGETVAELREVIESITFEP